MSFSGYCRIFRSANPRLKLASAKNVSTFSGDIVDLSYSSYNEVQDGSPTPVMVLHGLLDSRKRWAGISDSIHRNTGRRVINVDARNHGSSPHSPQHTYIHMAHDTAKLINALRLPKVSVLAHSMGGRTAMVLALLYPELISSLIVVDISPMSISESLTNNFPKILDFTANINIRQFTKMNEAIAYAKRELISFGMKERDLTLQIMLRNVGMKPDGTVGWICNMDVLNRYFQTLTRFPYIVGRNYPGPVLFIAGGQSDFIPLEDIDGIKRLFPQAEVEYVSGVGHNMHEEDCTMMLELATDFFSNKQDLRKFRRS